MRFVLMIEGQEGVSWEEWVALARACEEHGLEGLFRYDSFRPTTALTTRQNRTIAGLSYWFGHPGGASTAAILLDFEQVAFASFNGAGTAPAKQQRIALHGLINF